VKQPFDFDISMSSYITDTLRFYGKKGREYSTPANHNLFNFNPKAEPIVEKAKFHSVVAKLLYLGKRGRPEILLPVQFLCTRVQAPTEVDVKKLERVLGYLEMTKHWTSAFDDSTFMKVETYVDASFAIHSDGKSQSACMVMLGNTLVHEACGKQKIVTKSLTETELVALSD
jgi:hypothetical protein